MSAPRPLAAMAPLVAATLLLLAACGGSAVAGSRDDRDGGDLDASGDAFDATDAEPDASPDAADGGADVLEDVRSDFVDPGCPDAEPPPPTYDCDPYAQASGCPLGQACYPYVTHPFGEGCGFQQFGAVCLDSGSLGVGETCGDGAGRCAPGLICVIGARPGKRCAELCPLDGTANCPAGLICVETDAEGFGVCA